MIKVFLSPSNQDANIWCKGNTNEEREAVKFANDIAAKLSYYKIGVVRADGVEPFKRYQYARGCAAYIPLHTNAFNGEVRGNRLFILKAQNAQYSQSLLLASAIKAEFDKIGHTEKSRVYTDFARWNELANAAAIGVPCVYSETVFHDCPEDVDFYRANYAKIVDAYGRAIAFWCGVDVDAKPEPQTGKTFFRVIAGAFSDYDRAKSRLEDVKKIEPNAYIQTVKGE